MKFTIKKKTKIISSIKKLQTEILFNLWFELKNYKITFFGSFKLNWLKDLYFKNENETKDGNERFSSIIIFFFGKNLK